MSRFYVEVPVALVTNRPPAEPQEARWADRLNDVFELPLSDFGRQDVGLLNLLCAPSLPGSEQINITKCLARLDSLAAFVRASTERNLYRFTRGDCDYAHSEPMWRMSLLVTVIKLDFGVAYDPKVKADLERDGHSPFTDSRNAFIHGMLGDDRNRRLGSCSSIPVLVAAVARRLGYPVGLATTNRHIYARWDNGEDYAFNVEASNPMGMTTPDDDHYRQMHGGLSPEEQASGFYCRSLFPVEEFSLFCKARVWSLHDASRFNEALLWSARALQFAPDDPHFVHHAYATAMAGVRNRYRQKFPTRTIPPMERNHEFFFLYDDVLAVDERSLFMTIAGHQAEAAGDVERARGLFVDAARQNFHGNNEQRDLQRFLKKHGRARRDGPIVLPPKGVGQPRRITLPNCQPELEHEVLHRLADRFEREGNLLKARDTLHDLYLFDPCDGDVFQRARTLERQPRFQSQLKTVIAGRGRVLERTRQLEKYAN